jgi:TolB protein
MKNGTIVALLASAGLLAVTGTDYQLAAAKLGVFQDHIDVGITPKKGAAKFVGRKTEYRVTGGGANIWAKVDAFQMVYKKVAGDLVLTADVHFVGQGVEHHRKAALMVRQSLDPDSAYADAALHGDGLTSLQYRVATGEITKEERSELKGPVRLRIRRHGNEFTMEAGNSGDELKSTGPVTVLLHDPVYVGLAVGSHNADVLETAVFTNVELQGGEIRTRSQMELLAGLPLGVSK